jgi:hypothetical protein
MIEVITKDGVIFIDNPDESISILKTLPPSSIRLDYHGVLDTISSSEYLPNVHSYCVISYVGLNGEKHYQTREELLHRVQKGQILFAILVFQKGYKRKEKRAYVVPGSKAWVNFNLLQEVGKPTYFIDDHKEHLTSTELLSPHIHCIHYNTKLISNNSLNNVLNMITI